MSFFLNQLIFSSYFFLNLLGNRIEDQRKVKRNNDE